MKSISKNCVICKSLRARPANPLMADLPEGRVAYRQRPFSSHCGVDYFGPMNIKIGRRHEKRWGVIFTCLSTRAVHLEIAENLNTDSAIMALQRMAARRGLPTKMYSDNATNFKGASRELKEAISKINCIQLYDNGIEKKLEWIFNPPCALHMGGVWERLIRSIKSALNVALKEKVPRQEVLATTLAEIEHALNSRPLTKLSIDSQDSEALTPNHFLIGCSSGEIRFHNCETRDFHFRKQWKLAQHLADVFWERWRKEYLPLLLSRQKWHSEENPVKIGDLVLLVDDQLPRNEWKKGLVCKLFPNKDGQVRSVEVRTVSGNLIRGTRYLIKLLESEV